MVMTHKQCRRNFDRNKVTDRRTIKRLAAKFRETASVANARKRHSDWPRLAKIPNNKNLRKRLEKFIRKSTSCLSQDVCISRSLVLKTLHDDLKLFPCKVEILQRQTYRNEEK